MKNFFIIAKFFDFLISINLLKVENQNILYNKLDFYDIQLFSEKLFFNFFENGGIVDYVNYDYTPSYAYMQFSYLSDKKNISHQILKNFILNFKNSKKILMSEDNLSLIQKEDKPFQHVNSYSIIRSFAYLINNIDNKHSLEEAIRITKLANNHPIEVIGVYLLYKSMKYIKKNKNPYKLFKVLFDDLENLDDKVKKLLVGNSDKKEFNKFLLEVTANLFEFIRVKYDGDFKNIPNYKISSYEYYILFYSAIIHNNYKNKNIFICGNAVSTIFVAIDFYIEYYKLYIERNIIPINKIIMNLASILGFPHHSTLILSYFIYLLNYKKFINSIPKYIYKKIN
jgi:hypothetical protein